MRKMAGSARPFPCVRFARAETHGGEIPGGKEKRVCVCPRAEDRFPDRQRQVMASPAMGSQAYRFTGLGVRRCRWILDYVSRSVREGWLAGREGKFSRRFTVTSSRQYIYGTCGCSYVTIHDVPLYICVCMFTGSVAFETERRVEEGCREKGKSAYTRVYPVN